MGFAPRTPLLILAAAAALGAMSPAEALTVLYRRPYGTRGRSDASRLARRERAVRRGYWSPLAPGLTAIPVPTPVAPRARRAVAGLVATRDLELATRTHRDNAGELLRAVADRVPAAVGISFAGAVQSANAAKHRSWLDAPRRAERREAWADCSVETPVGAPGIEIVDTKDDQESVDVRVGGGGTSTHVPCGAAALRVARRGYEVASGSPRAEQLSAELEARISVLVDQKVAEVMRRRDADLEEKLGLANERIDALEHGKRSAADELLMAAADVKGRESDLAVEGNQLGAEIQEMALFSLEPEANLYFCKTPLLTSPRQTLKVTNLHSTNIAFRVKVTAPKSYIVRPASGTLKPRESRDVGIVHRPTGCDQANNHRFMVQAVPVVSDDNVSREDWCEFDKDAIQELRLSVVLEEHDDAEEFRSMLRLVGQKLNERTADIRDNTLAIEAGLRSEIEKRTTYIRDKTLAIEAGLRSETLAIEAGLRSEVEKLSRFHTSTSWDEQINFEEPPEKIAEMAISRYIVKKCIELFVEIAEEKGDYKKFAEQFGKGLKLDDRKGSANRIKVAQLLRFHTSTSDDEQICVYKELPLRRSTPYLDSSPQGPRTLNTITSGTSPTSEGSVAADPPTAA